MKLSDKHIVGLGCLGELVVLAVGLVLLKSADANASARSTDLRTTPRLSKTVIG